MNKLRFNLEDISQIIIGSFALCVPISFSQEAWEIAKTLPNLNLFLLILLTLFFLGFYSYQSIFQTNIKKRIPIFIFRIFIAYFITIIVVGLTLLALDKLPLLTDAYLAIKRVIIISMPASIGAIIVDSLDKE
ncbi:DUF2391 family protein [Malaciobacter mytili]|uniref:DUF2391 domain-containing membrane protein n=1 Tax=Malaciobacter mytili LMG 24559 TaxID=1032238 RepID=A0AAX2AEC0_9BACT|nr:DUF2391 family protein [Malaciobacter mytili]AXH15337.1 DUF2391 domain-containing membrane protein [Malaciobacter mytili LMG 24559]RXK15384.1 hypothetical protein CP985_09030 [Malaciobacter mytili LMG 24559]